MDASAALVTTPATVKNVSYSYSDRVMFIDLSDATSLGDAVKIPGTALSAGDVVVDGDGNFPVGKYTTRA